MLTTLFSDLGDVMFLFNFKVFEQEVAKRAKKVPEKLRWEESLILKQSFTGRTSGKRFLEIRAKELGIDPHEIVEIWNRAVIPNEPYLDFLKCWKKEGKRLYLLSNINMTIWNHYRHHPIFKLFDDLFLSYRLRLAKPNPKIFIACLEKTGERPEQSLFIDDLKENVEAACALGFKTWQYAPEEHNLLLNFIALYTQTHGELPSPN